MEEIGKAKKVKNEADNKDGQNEKKKSKNRLKREMAKQFCSLPINEEKVGKSLEIVPTPNPESFKYIKSSDFYAKRQQSHSSRLRRRHY